MSNKKNTQFTSPKGIAKYPKLDQPYTYNTAVGRSMPDPKGQYEVALIMSKADFAPFKQTIDEAIAKSGFKPQHLPYKKEIDKDTGEETGNVEVKFKAYGADRSGKRNRIPFCDAKTRPMPSNLALTSGSTIKIDGWISVAAMGARLNIRSVQVINLVERASAFQPEEGYEYDGELDDEIEDEAENNNNNKNNNEAKQNANNENFNF
jgi:hypothetical protein